MRTTKFGRRSTHFVAWGAGLICLLTLPAACAGQLEIEDLSVAGPAANFAMSSRLMTSGKRMKVAISVPGLGKAALPKFNGTFFYRRDTPEATSATLLMRTDGLKDLEGSLAMALSQAFDFEEHPFLSFQSEAARATPEGVALEGILIVKTKETRATLQLVIPGRVAVNDKDESFLEAQGRMSVDPADVGLASIGTSLDFDLDLFLFNYTTASAVATGIDKAALDASPPRLPTKADELSNAGWYLMLTKRYPQAIEAFDMSIKSNSRDVSAYFRRGDAYVFNGDYGKAMGTYEALRVLMPLQPHILELSKILDNQRLTPESLQAAGRMWHERQR